MRARRLPDSVRDVAEVIGETKALLLVSIAPRCYPPSRKTATASHSAALTLYIPSQRRLPLDHRLVQVLGYNDAMKLSRHFGGEVLRLANCKYEVYLPHRDRGIIDCYTQGTPIAMIAEWFGLSTRAVSDIIAEAK